MSASIATPDRRLRVFVSSTIEELASERAAARDAIETLRLTPVLFELGARPHPPADVYRAYLDQSDVFVAVYGERYGWIGPGMEISGLEDELRRAVGKPRLVYVKTPAPGRDDRLSALIDELMRDAAVSFKTFAHASELNELLRDDLAVLLTERFASGGGSPVHPVLPASPDEFVGRERELALLSELLVRDARLVTVTGPGGVGKTRLAVESARRAAERFEHGAHFVPLGAVLDAELVVPTIVSTLALPSDTTLPALDVLLGELRDKNALLVLDNFEQLLAAASVVAGILASCPKVVVVATSRAVLKLRGEHELHLEPLVGTDGVQLFVERARQVDASFALTDENAAAVAGICRRVEGLPLALELAAARIRLLSPASMLTRLEAGFEVLAEGPRDLPERQRTLRSAIDWSVALLDEPEQQLLARASVFHGGWSLDAAEAVCRSNGEVAPRLEGLMEHSLVKRERVGAVPQYSMLETIRAYAAERLTASAEAPEIRRRHAEFFLELADDHGRRLRGAGQSAALEQLDVEVGNLRAAFTWCLETGAADSLAVAAWSLMHFWWLRGHIDEGGRWADAALEAPSLSESGRAHVLLLKGSLAVWRSDHAGGAPLVEEAANVFAAVGDTQGAAFARVVRAATRAGAGDREAIAQLEQDRDLLAQSGDEYGALTASNGLCWALIVLGVDAPLELYERTVADARALGVEAELATARGNLGGKRLLRGELEEAKVELREALRIAQRLRSRTGMAHYVARLAELAAREGAWEAAVRLSSAAAAIGGQAGPGPYAEAQARLVETARAELGDDVVEAARRAGAEHDLDAAAAEALAWADEQTAPS